MTFILSENRSNIEEIVPTFEKYFKYLESVKEQFPKSAYQLATSEWYYDPRDPKCPHDSWLVNLSIGESGTGERNETRTNDISIKLLGAYHDGHIKLHYLKVKAYSLGHQPKVTATGESIQGHGDWLYDEFRLSENGLVLHEIEWAHGRWLIEATDVEFQWVPTPTSS